MQNTPTGKFVWFDIPVTDAAKAMPFFKAVFAWDFEPMGPTYQLIKVDGLNVGGLTVEKDFTPAKGFTPYFNVPSITEAKGLVTKNGGKLVGDIVTIGDGTMGFFQNFTDLDGNALSLWSMKN